MKHNPSKKQDTLLITFKNSKSKVQYIRFSPNFSKKILILFKKPTKAQEQLKHRKAYKYIIGRQIYSLESPFINTDILLQTLKNITSLGGQQFNGKRFMQILPNGQSIKSFQLKLSSIQHITFDNLRFLDFTCCYLDNIQALEFLDMKNLEQLKFLANNIVSLKPLSKTSLVNLSKFWICNNKYTYHSLNYLQRFNSPQLSYIYVQIIQKQEKYHINLDVLYTFVKFQINQIRWENQQKLGIRYKKNQQYWKQPKWMLQISKNYLLQWRQL